MSRSTLITTMTLLAFAGLGAAHHAVPPACTLLSAQDAAKLAGFAVTVDPDNSTGGSCVYNRTGAPPTGADGVEVTVKQDADAATAHTEYPTWVKPFPKPNPMMAYIPISGIGDEATLVHINHSPSIAAIDFRHGPVLVKVGVYPQVGDSALTAAARTMIGRM